ncbi:ROK family transcriptional regulator [Streptosporangium oxazolinicum]|uniref:ROK family transcriptional regulator n=1 Tax=Streptosporangium oxazolinicum TaxID=909287 RepID=A0ABP8APT7_9ACTN
MAAVRQKTVHDLRRSNRAAVLRALYLGGPASRQQLSEVASLSPATVSNVVGELLAYGVIYEAGQAESQKGRPRVLLRINTSHGYVIGIDVGETHVRVELFDLEMNRQAKIEYALRPARHDPEIVVRHILAGIELVLSEAGITPGQVLGVGVGVPGVVEKGPDAVIHAPSFGWDAVPLGKLLREGTSLPLYVDNGAKSMGQAELWFGAGRGAQHVVTVLIGSGVGASIIADGVTYLGANSSAGEWGHTKIMADGRACRCGGRGCLEAYVGAKSILERAGLWSETIDEPTALAGLLSSGSPVIEETVNYLGIGLANLINLFNPERIVIGGWAGVLLGERLLVKIRQATEKNCLARPYTTAAIGLGRLGVDSIALGAATLVVEEFLLNSAPAERATE